MRRHTPLVLFIVAIAVIALPGIGRSAIVEADMDAYITNSTGGDDNFGSANPLQIKNRSNDLTNSSNRKVYVGFTALPTESGEFTAATLYFTMAGSQGGSQAGTPTWNFDVYALSESVDTWTEGGITWANAPGNITSSSPGGGLEPYGVDTSVATLVGTFQLIDGATTGSVSVTDSALLDFLNTDTDGRVSFIIHRRENETNGGSIVHGMYSREHLTGVDVQDDDGPRLEYTFVAVPEPTTLALLGLGGLVGFAAQLRRR